MGFPKGKGLQDRVLNEWSSLNGCLSLCWCFASKESGKGMKVRKMGVISQKGGTSRKRVRESRNLACSINYNGKLASFRVRDFSVS